jgi:hypothetical protein
LFQAPESVPDPCTFILSASCCWHELMFRCQKKCMAEHWWVLFNA